MLKVIFLTAFFVYLPENAFAWGPMTHCYLANELLKYLALLPPDISLIIRNFKQDFVYGNIMADSVMGKRFMPKQNHSHSWEFALSLFKQASTQSERSFVYGYLCHLAADTVAHRELTIKMKDIEHSWVEFTIDSLVDRTNRIKSLTINRLVQKRNDRFLKKSLPHHVLPFDTHKRIFKGFLVLSALTNFSRINNLNINRKEIFKLHEESLIRMIDVMSNGFQSCVTKEDPSPYQDV